MSYHVQLLDPRHDAEPPYWESWRRRAGLWANWAWPLLRAGALTSRDPVLLTVLCRCQVSDDADTVAGVVAATVCRPSPLGALPRLFARQARPSPERGRPRIGYLHVQAPQSSAQPGWWFDTDDPVERTALFRAYTRTARRALGRGVGGVLWRQLGAEDVPLLPRRLLVRRTEPVAVLDTPFADVESWLKGLRKSRRQDLRRIFRRLAADPDLDVLAGASADVADPAELARLVRLNHDKHGAAAADRNTGPRTVAWQQVALGHPEVTTVAYRDGSGRLLGAGTILDHARQPLWLTWGAEPVEQGGRRHLYFDFIGRVVELAVAGRRDGVVLGKGTTELKVDLGARLVPQYAAVTRTG